MGQMRHELRRFPARESNIISIKPSPLRWGVWPQMQQANSYMWNLSATDARYRLSIPRPAAWRRRLTEARVLRFRRLAPQHGRLFAWKQRDPASVDGGRADELVMPGLRVRNVGTRRGLRAPTARVAGLHAAHGRRGHLGHGRRVPLRVQPLTGNGHITARVVSQSSSSLWAKRE